MMTPIRILQANAPIADLVRQGGGKAANLARMGREGFAIPDWFCVTVDAFREFLRHNGLDPRPGRLDDPASHAGRVARAFAAARLPVDLRRDITRQLREMGLEDRDLAVRSSGLEEDSAAHSFAGQYASFLFQRGPSSVIASLKRCWASCYSERALRYRLERGLPVEAIETGVVIQRMVNAEVSGVVFSRNPLDVADRETLLIESVFGVGEGLVSGSVASDRIVVRRRTLESTVEVAEKRESIGRGLRGGVVAVPVPPSLGREPSLDAKRIEEVARAVLRLEARLEAPQDCEWAYEGGVLWLLQTRPITTLPTDAFHDPEINGRTPTLWDNSNIVESYGGVTSPLTFSFASRAYRQVYTQFLELMGVTRRQISDHDTMLRNMLGLMRGRIYYNLVNWYQLILFLPGARHNREFMETMMGVKQTLSPDLAGLFASIQAPPRLSRWRRMIRIASTVWRFLRLQRIVTEFRREFERITATARQENYLRKSLPELRDEIAYLECEVLQRWKAPILNDYFCMVFFGLLRRLTGKWIAPRGDAADSLHNDLLRGEGRLESTLPTKMLMRIAAWVDDGDPAQREFVLSRPAPEVWRAIDEGDRFPGLRRRIGKFLERFGYRCADELKLEAPDLHDDPSFAIAAVARYVRSGQFDVDGMERRERTIRERAERQAEACLGPLERVVYFWVLKHARRAVRNRESLRFDRTRIFGIARRLFRAVGHHLVRLGLLRSEEDVFYLTVDEILAEIEGRSLAGDLAAVAAIRKKESAEYRRTAAPPDRFLTRGAAAISGRWSQVLASGDLLRHGTAEPEAPESNRLTGTPCCPGVVQGVVRVALDVKDAEGIQDEILVTERTDPGWVPLFPSCSGLLVERGGLLSHSAVVAREFGLPTIVGIKGGLIRRLRTGMRVVMDAGRGEVRILS